MVNLRLTAYATGSSPDIEIITGDNKWTAICLLFAGRSPRDMIRILNQFVIEATRKTPYTTVIDEYAKESAIDEFSRQRANELAGPRLMQRLQRIRAADFGASDCSNRMNVGIDTARRYLRDMEQRGAISRVSARPHPGETGRPETWYALSDIRVARAAFPDLDMPRDLDPAYSVLRCENIN